VTGAPTEATRDATEGDVDEVAALCRRAASELDAERGGRIAVLTGALAEPLEEALLGRIVSTEALVTVGTLDGALVGTAVAHVVGLQDGGCVAHVDVLYVEPDARSVGVGESLLGRVLGWALEQGCGGVDAPALPGMRDSKNFFERAGFVARLLVMHRPTAP
jgi:GNAT superfamily N-acetyltransferase